MPSQDAPGAVVDERAPLVRDSSSPAYDSLGRGDIPREDARDVGGHEGAPEATGREGEEFDDVPRTKRTLGE